MASRAELPFFYDITLKLFQDAGFVPKVHHEVGYPTMVLGLVGTGAGISLVPESIRNIQCGGVAFVPLHEPSRTLETVVAWRRSGVSPMLTEFLNVVRHSSQAGRPVPGAPLPDIDPPPI
jgi:DNA-binding transcriptional LysR family regulator